MKKVALLLVLLFSISYGCNANFGSCLKKVQDLHVIKNGTLSIPIEKKKLLVYSLTPLKKYLKKDPFTNLYIVETSQSIHHPFKINKHLPSLDVASIGNGVTCGRITQHQMALEHFGKFSKKTQTPAVILNGCCELVALDLPEGVVEKEYINHFIRYGSSFGELGIRVRQCAKGVVVDRINPFLPSPFLVGDCIEKIGKKRIDNLKEFYQATFFMLPEKKLHITLRRCNKRLTLDATLYKKQGGGVLSDTFLETIGVYLDKTLHVIASTNKTLHVGDKIVMVEKSLVKNYEDIQKALTQIKKDRFLIGVNRKGLELFLPIEKTPL